MANMVDNDYRRIGKQILAEEGTDAGLEAANQRNNSSGKKPLQAFIPAEGGTDADMGEAFAEYIDQWDWSNAPNVPGEELFPNDRPKDVAAYDALSPDQRYAVLKELATGTPASLGEVVAAVSNDNGDDGDDPRMEQEMIEQSDELRRR